MGIAPFCWRMHGCEHLWVRLILPAFVISPWYGQNNSSASHEATTLAMQLQWEPWNRESRCSGNLSTKSETFLSFFFSPHTYNLGFISYQCDVTTLQQYRLLSAVHRKLFRSHQRTTKQPRPLPAIWHLSKEKHFILISCPKYHTM